MFTSRNNDPRWILATIVESGNHRFWGLQELFFVTFFWLLFFLPTWNQNLFFCFRAEKFSSAAPISIFLLSPLSLTLGWLLCLPFNFRPL